MKKVKNYILLILCLFLFGIGNVGARITQKEVYFEDIEVPQESTTSHTGDIEVPQESTTSNTGDSNIGEVCGNIPKKIPEIVSKIVILLEVAIPLVIIIYGMVDMFKSVTSSDEKEIAKHRKVFITRLVTGLLAFFIIFVVRFTVRLVADSDSKGIIDCVNCFINNNCN